MAERLLRPDRLQQLLANLLDDSSATVREGQAHLKALRTERTRMDGAIHNMFDFIEKRVVSAGRRLHRQACRPAHAPRRPRTGDPAGRAAAIRRRPPGDASGGEPARRGHPDEAAVRRPDPAAGNARRFIAKVVVAPDVMTIAGPIKALEIAVNGDPDNQAPMVPCLDREWCPCTTQRALRSMNSFGSASVNSMPPTLHCPRILIESPVNDVSRVRKCHANRTGRAIAQSFVRPCPSERSQCRRADAVPGCYPSLPAYGPAHSP